MDTLTIASLGVLAVVLIAMKIMPRLVAGVPFVAPADVKARMDKGEELLIIDVRSVAEFSGASGHVSGALNVPVGELSVRIAQVASKLEPYKATPVFVMCHTANRAPYAARALKKAGFSNISVINGGMSRWLRDGLPATQTQ